MSGVRGSGLNQIASDAPQTKGVIARTAQSAQEIPDETAVQSLVGPTLYTPQGPNNLLMRLRAEFPFVPIMPWPNAFATVVLAAGVAQDLIFPEGTALFILSGNGDYYVSMQEKAQIAAATPSPTAQIGSIYKPEFSWFFAQSKSLSVIAPNNGTIVQAACYIPRGLPEIR